MLEGMRRWGWGKAREKQTSRSAKTKKDSLEQPEVTQPEKAFGDGCWWMLAAKARVLRPWELDLCDRV